MIETEPFLLHPLVVLGISDHYVRAKINNNVKEPTFGGVVGTRSAGGGCCTELQATFELALTGSGDAVDTELAEARAEQYRKVFPEYVFLGWYAVAPVSDTLMSQLTGLAEGSGRVLLVFDPARADGMDTPVEAYTVEDARRLRRLPLKVVASDPERIGVDHIIRCSDATEAPQFLTHLSGLSNSLEELCRKVEAVCRRAEQMASGEIPYDCSFSRKAYFLSRMLSVAGSPDFKQTLLEKYENARMIAYMSTITMIADTLNELVSYYE